MAVRSLLSLCDEPDNHDVAGELDIDDASLIRASEIPVVAEMNLRWLLKY